MTAEEAAFEPTVVTPRYSSYALRRLRTQAAERARAARRGIAVALPLIVAVLLVFYYRDDIPGPVIPVRIACTVALVILGWRFARDVGRAMGPTLLQRLEPGTAGTVEFLIRLATVGVAVLAALRVAGLRPETLAVGGAMTAVVLGLAAQQTFGNLVAGVVLLSARPFRVGERISLQGAGVNVEGEVASLGLLHTTLASGQDNVMIPNSLVLSVAIIPLREPASVDLRARLRPGVKPSDVQTLLDRAIETPVRGQPHISLEEVDDQEVIVRIEATPESDEDGPRLADEVLTAVESATREPAAAGAGTGTGTGASRD
ncbi:MAG TPA: mechanosensitive ion channel family protein [Thermoleophilaceae bacterium]|nr:mechanosensitive ion channel family protein [Thermoleophilaceae bacterium]